MKLALYITASLIGTAAQAQLFDKVTQVDSTEAREQLYSELRSGLKTHAGEINTLPSVGASESRSGMTSSFFFKELLANAQEKMLKEVKYGTPVPIDPTMTLTEVDRKLQQKDTQVCVAAINEKGFDVQSNSDMDLLLIQVRSLVEKDKVKKSTAAVPIPANEKAVIRVIRPVLNAAPRNSKGQTIENVLGQLQDLDFFAGRVRNMFFTNGQNLDVTSDNLGPKDRVSLSLSMLISVRTEHDEAFVRLMRGLVEYLGEQKRVFARRAGLLMDKPATLPTLSLFKTLNLDGSKASPVNFDRVAPSQLEAYTLKYFLEGHPGFPNAAQEADFMSLRLARISGVEAYLQDRLQGALNASSKLTQLSPEQLDYLIDLFLQLNHDDLPVPEQMEELKFAAVEADQATKEGQQLMDSLVYYRQMSRDLQGLKRHLVEDNKKAAAKKRDLEQIRK